jgi:hypothetical protein
MPSPVVGSNASQRTATAPVLVRLREHIEKAHREGLRQAARADARRSSAAFRRLAWRAVHDCSPRAVPVYVVGIQCSGTNMLFHAFEECPEIETHNESAGSQVFANFQLRSDEILRAAIESSRHRFILFKPLADSHDVVHLMTGLGTPSPGKAVWIYRAMEGRVRSVLARWPENNRRVLREVASGGDNWEGRGLSPERLELLRRFDYERMTQASGAALLWYVRNALFFDLGLDARDDVALVSYERFLAEPERLMRQIAAFVGVRFRSRMIDGIAPRPPATPGGLELDPEIAELGAELQQRLDAELARRL